jgi:hypothetical protein
MKPPRKYSVKKLGHLGYEEAAQNTCTCLWYTLYEVLSKIFRTGAAIYTSVVVARGTGPKNQTVNFRFYCDFFLRLRENVRRSRPELWPEQTWLLHHDNAPSHVSVLIQQFLAKNKMAVFPQRPFSPDLAPCDFFLFPKMKFKLKGRRFDTNEEIRAE